MFEWPGLDKVVLGEASYCYPKVRLSRHLPQRGFLDPVGKRTVLSKLTSL
jgi:hypothetical protein